MVRQENLPWVAGIYLMMERTKPNYQKKLRELRNFLYQHRPVWSPVQLRQAPCGCIILDAHGDDGRCFVH